MDVLAPSEADACAEALASGKDVLLPCCALTLSSQGDPVQTSYGVQCLLHVEDSLSSVTVSSLARRAEFLDEALLEVRTPSFTSRHPRHCVPRRSPAVSASCARAAAVCGAVPPGSDEILQILCKCLYAPARRP